MSPATGQTDPVEDDIVIPASPSLNQQLYNSVAALAVFRDQLLAKRQRVAECQHEETLALMALNKEQRRFNKLCALVKKTPPPGTIFHGELND